MLEQVDLSRKMPKEEYKPLRNELISKLVVLQQEARSAGVGLVVLFEGWKGAGKGSRMGDLLHNLDARATHVHVISSFDEEETLRFRDMDTGVTGFAPLMQEFWSSLGPRGDMTIYERGWYTAAARRLLYADREEVVQTYRQAASEFERQLTADGYVVVKFFVHVSQDAQRKRLTRLSESPDTAWRVTQQDLDQVEDYEEIYHRYDELLRSTNYDFAPWTLINGEDKRSANIDIAKTLVEALERALSKAPDPAAQAAAQKAAKNSAGALVAQDPRKRSAEESARVLEEARHQARVQSEQAPRHTRFTVVPNPPLLEELDHSCCMSR